MADLLLKNIVKKYDQNIVVHDFNLEIKDKEFMVLVGPSGCGKTTTLRMIAGLEDITAGELYIGGRLVNDIEPMDRDIAMVFQSYALYPHMTVYENMAFGLRLRKMPKAEIDSRVKEAAGILSIGHLLERKPKALSGGQRQRVALGRAIVREPRVFLMDEPLSNLDANLRVQMRAEITKLRHRLQATVVYVTHDQTEAMTMGDRIVVMKDGRIQQVDTPINLYNHPQNMFVAKFIGSPSMNFIKGQVVQEGQECFLLLSGLKLKVAAEHADKIRPYTNKEVILGIRPEAVYDNSLFIEANPEWVFDAVPDVVEHMGSETYVYFTLNCDTVIARLDAKSQAARQVGHRIGFDMSMAHYFDTETEKAIV